MSTANLRTGDLKKFRVSEVFNGPAFDDDKWATIDDEGFWVWRTRRQARYAKNDGGRIAKILKITPKTVTVEISK